MPPSTSYALRHLQDVCGGDHICFLCTSHEERWRVLGEFYAKGLEKNEQMMFFNHNMTEDFILNGLSQKIPNISDVVKNGQFQILPYSNVYLTNGKFDAEALIARLARLVDHCLAEGYTALRACGDMSWVHSEDNLTRKLIHYEANLNYDWPTHYSAICMYDISAFQPNDMLQILSTHPQAVIKEKLLQNIYYMPPDEYLGDNLSKAMLERWMHNIEERKNVEEQLIESKMQAEKAAAAKANFLANMSHEIRNPLNGIIGSVDMLAQTLIAEEHRELIEIIQASCKHLYRVVNDVLDFSKIESGKLQLLMEPLSVPALISDSLRLCQYSIQKNLSVSLKQHIHPLCPDFIIGDETKLRQILVNLVGNACKFTERGKVVVSVKPVSESTNQDLLEKAKRERGTKRKGETEKGKEGESEKDNSFKVMLEFSVADTGAGIDANDQCLLFQTFTKLDASRKWAGTGLGLAICRQLVESMGGHIHVKSALGEGSTFYFQIPVSLPPTNSSVTNSMLGTSVDSLHVSPTISPALTPSGSPTLSTSSFSFALKLPQKNESSSNQSSTGPIPLSPSSNSSPSTQSGLPSLSLSPSLSPPEHLSPPIESKSELISEHKSQPKSTQSKSAPPTPNPNSQPQRTFSGQNILVVEDDVINQKVLKHMLLKLKCDVTIANNGLEALKLATDNQYTLIITDQYMPTMDGVTSILRMRESMQSQGRSLCPVIVCTGTDEPRLHDVMDHVLIKPINFTTLVDSMSRFCVPITT